MAPILTLAECAKMAKEVGLVVDALRRAATVHGLTINQSHDTEGVLIACENLLGAAWAGFHNAANDERAKRGEPLVRPYSDGQKAVAQQFTLTERDRQEAAEAAGRA